MKEKKGVDKPRRFVYRADMQTGTAIDNGSSDTTFFTVEEIAKRLRRDVQTIRRWIRSGRLQAFRLEGGYLITDAQLQEYLARNLSVSVAK